MPSLRDRPGDQDKGVTVQIYGQTYRLGNDTCDPEQIQRAAAYLDARIRQAAAWAGSRSPLDVVVLAALSVAEEVLAARRQKDALLDEADQRLSTFARRLEG
ncbi:MAG: cell division protein ZapA [Candidatus Latescibacterota bacterium]